MTSLLLQLYKTRTQFAGTVCYGTAPQDGRSRVRFPMVSLGFFIDLILPVALWSWDRLSL